MEDRLIPKTSANRAGKKTGVAEAAKGISLSIVIPAYNEAARISATLYQVLQYGRLLGQPYEVIVVDDGSTDATTKLVEKISEESGSVRLVRNAVNCGKGIAVRNGVLNAQGEYILFSDADLSAPLAEARHLLEPLRSGYDVAIGSRALRRDWIGVHQSAFRESAGRLFNMFIRVLTGLEFRDTQCGFKAFRRQSARAIFARQRIAGFGFDVEVLYLARKFGYRTMEVPVHWDHSAASKVHPLRDGAQMLWDVLRIRWNDWTGKYDRGNDP